MAGMSARTRDLPRRSCHAVPGSNPRFIEKAAECGTEGGDCLGLLLALEPILILRSNSSNAGGNRFRIIQTEVNDLAVLPVNGIRMK